ncbi:MAG: phage major capsid protein, partial [Prevotellaceae bacterium]|nr:phage major capsid protein [Prevotellaceae bacterium]
MIGLRTLYKNSKKNSLYGMKAKRKLNIIALASIIFMLVGVMCLATDTPIGYGVGTTVMATPVVFAIPKSNKEIIKEKKSKLERSFVKIRKSLDEDGLAMLDQIMEELNGLYDLADNEGQVEIFNKLQEKLTEIEGKLPKEEDTAAAEEELKSLKQTIAELKLGNHGSKGEYFRKQLENFMQTEDFKDAMSSGKAHTLVVKAAATITTANAAGAPHALSFEIIPGIQEKPTEELTVLALLNKGATSSRTIIWVDRQDKDGGAAFIAEGALKP